MAVDTMELLFFDTFSHESNEELNLDLVQFPDPVYINEVRIIPLGTRVQADFPGGVRLGATNPSQFELEFFVNDLSKTGASTFEGLGSLEYKQNVDIQLTFKKKIPTDGLVLRGWYTTITIAIYGSVSKLKERNSPPPPPPPQTAQKIRSGEKDTTDTTVHAEWDRDSQSETDSVIQSSSEQVAFSDSHTPIQEHGHYPPDHPKPAYSERTTYPEHQSYDYDFPPGRSWSSTVGEHQTNPNKLDNFPKERNIYGRSTYPRDSYDEKKSNWDHKDRDRDSRDPRTQQREKERIRDGREYREHDRVEFTDYENQEVENEPGWEKSSEPVDKDSEYRDSTADRTRYSEREDELNLDISGDRDFRDRTAKRDVGKGESQRTDGKRPRTPPLSSSPKRRPRTPPLPSEDDQRRARGPCSPPLPKDEIEPGEVPDDKIPSDLFDPLTPDDSPDQTVDNLSDGEIHEGETNDGGYSEFLYDEILSDEEFMSDGEERNLDLPDLYYEMSDDSWNYISSFNPYQCELAPLLYFSDPSLTQYEIEKKKMGCPPDENAMETAQKLLKTLEYFEDKEHSEKWVEAMELLPSMLVPGLAILKQSPELKGIVNVLLDWLTEGLNFDKAVAQTQAVYKVRHMKAGIRLAIAMSNCDYEMTHQLLEKNVQRKLLNLYEKEYMALSVKLLIIQGLDATTRTEEGMKYFLRIAGLEQKSNYQRLLNFILGKQSTRAAVAVSALLKKIHVFEIISKFTGAVEKLVDNIATFELSSSKPEGAKDSDIEQAIVNSADGEMENFCMNYLNDNETEDIISYLVEINKMLGHAQQFIAQPMRFLPTKSQFEMPESPHDAYPGLYSLLKNKRFLETIFILLTCPGVSNHVVLFDSVKDVMTTLMRSQHGLLFLLSQPDVLNGIVRLLTQPSDDGRDENSEETPPHQLGLQLVYHLQVLQYVDSLLDFHSKDSTKKELDDPEALSVLQPLYTMVFLPIGRQVVVDVLSIEHNLNALVPFLELTGDEQNDIKIRKSASMGYATELLLVITHYSENVCLLKNFGDKLLNICTQESSSKLQEIVSWFSVMKRIPSYSADAVTPLCTITKNLIEEVLTFPGELITSVRILKDLCIPPTTNLKSEEQREELKYRYAIIQFIANDGLIDFITILQKICDAYQYPYPQNYAVIGPQWGLLLALIKPIISILKHSLCYLIYCRNAEFKDLLAVPIILRAYSFLSILPVTSSFYPVAQGIQSEIIEILLAYTQPVMTISDSDETLSESLWSQMLHEVLKFVTTLPSNFLSGVTILSELLPLPLPIQTRESLSNDDIVQATNARKLWSAHLHSMSGEIQDIIKKLLGTSLPLLQHQLRRVCVQLADLAASSSLVVTRAILDAVLDTLEDQEPEELENKLFHSNSHTFRLLNMLDCLANQPCIKISLLQLLRANTKLDEKYGQFLPKLSLLLNSTLDKPVHVQIQECIVSLFQTVCDYEILLCSENAVSPLDQLGNALPAKDQMVLICSALLDHVTNSNHSFSTTLQAFRTLVMILETDVGFYCLKMNFEKKPETLHNILSRCVTTFNKDSVDSIGLLNTCLDFIRLLYTDDSAQGVSRNLFFTVSELAFYLQWKTNEEKEEDEEEIPIHPLIKIEKILLDFVKDDDSVDVHNADNVSSLILQMNIETPKMDRDIPEPNFSQSDTLSAQFQARATYVINESDDDRFSPTYWLLQANADDSDQEVELVSCDLENMAERFCPGLDLKTELGKESLTKDSLLPLKCKKKGNNLQPTTLGKRKYQPLINPGQKERSGKKPFIAPMRGRGFSRTGIHPSRANDPFRSRPPNTSRPPSMHVDDFVALETFHPNSVPTGPTNKRPSKDNNRGRGRGNFDGNRPFAGTRGRFLQNQQGGSYNARRGDDKSGRGSNEWINRSVSRGNSGNVSPWNTRSGQLLPPKNATKANSNMPRNFPRGGSHMEPRTDMRTTPGNARSQESYGRFQRTRGGNNSGNWSGSRSKERTDGRGRRDGNRHVRALTR